ncbi:tetratricopeptide repeat protein, partial [candidate division KSB1 bacterium]
FGYVESYTIVTVLLAGFFIGGLRSIKKNISPLIPSFFLGLSVSTHTSAVVLIPALFYLWFRYFSIHSRIRERILAGFCGVGLFSLPMLITAIIIGMNGFPLSDFAKYFLKEENLLPFSGADKPVDVAYGMFSISHFLDIINELYLVAPFFFVGIFVIFIYRKKLLFRIDPHWLFLGISSMIYLLCLCGFNLQKGGSRDWDILSSMAIPLTLFTMRSIFLVKKRLNRSELTIFGMFLLVHIIPWLVVNANEGWSLNRFKVMAEDSKWSPEAKGDGFDELRAYCENKGDYGSAYVYAKKAASNINSTRYLNNWAVMALRLNHFDEAASIFRDIIEMDPNYYTAYINYSEVLFQQDKLKEALAICETARKKFKTPELYYNIAFLMDNLGLYDEAIGHYKEVLKMDPNYYKAYFNYSGIYYKTEQFDKALIILEGAKGKFKTPELYYNIALVLKKLNRMDEAVSHFKDVLIMNPNYYNAYLNYGAVLLIKGQFEEALAVCESAKQRFETPELYFNTALVLEKLGRNYEAIQNAKNALKLKPNFPNVLNFIRRLSQKEK